MTDKKKPFQKKYLLLLAALLFLSYLSHLLSEAIYKKEQPEKKKPFNLLFYKEDFVDVLELPAADTEIEDTGTWEKYKGKYVRARLKYYCKIDCMAFVDSKFYMIRGEEYKNQRHYHFPLNKTLDRYLKQGGMYIVSFYFKEIEHDKQNNSFYIQGEIIGIEEERE